MSIENTIDRKINRRDFLRLGIAAGVSVPLKRIYLPFIGTGTESVKVPEKPHPLENFHLGEPIQISKGTASERRGTVMALADENNGLALWQQFGIIDHETWREGVLEVVWNPVAKSEPSSPPARTLATISLGSMEGDQSLTNLESAAAWAGHPAVVWSEAEQQYIAAYWHNQSGMPEVVLQRFNRQGELVGEPITVDRARGSRQHNPDVAVDPETGVVLVVWQNDFWNSRDWSYDFFIYGQRFGLAGPMDEEPFPITNTGREQHPKAAVLKDNTNGDAVFVVTYMSPAGDAEGSVIELRGKTISSKAGESDDSCLIAVASSNVGIPDLAANQRGTEAMVVWEDRGKISGRVINPLGPVGPIHDLAQPLEGMVLQHPQAAGLRIPEGDGWVVSFGQARLGEVAQTGRIYGLHVLTTEGQVEAGPAVIIFASGELADRNQGFSSVTTLSNTILFAGEIEMPESEVFGVFGSTSQ